MAKLICQLEGGERSVLVLAVVDLRLVRYVEIIPVHQVAKAVLYADHARVGNLQTGLATW